MRKLHPYDLRFKFFSNQLYTIIRESNNCCPYGDFSLHLLSFLIHYPSFIPSSLPRCINLHIYHSVFQSPSFFPFRSFSPTSFDFLYLFSFFYILYHLPLISPFISPCPPSFHSLLHPFFLPSIPLSPPPPLDTDKFHPDDPKSS